MTAMQHVCTWRATEDERFQVCGDEECEIWRWSPTYSQKAADEAHRKTLDGPRAPSRPAGRPRGSEVTGDARPTEGDAA